MPAQPIMMQQAKVLRDGVADYEGRLGPHATTMEDGRLTGWMLSAVGLIEMPVGEMPTRGAPTLMPVAPMLMPAGDVLMKQGLYEKTEPPPETCTARQTHHATCHARIGIPPLKPLLPLTNTHVLLHFIRPYSWAVKVAPLNFRSPGSYTGSLRRARGCIGVGGRRMSHPQGLLQIMHKLVERRHEVGGIVCLGQVLLLGYHSVRHLHCSTRSQHMFQSYQVQWMNAAWLGAWIKV